MVGEKSCGGKARRKLLCHTTDGKAVVPVVVVGRVNITRIEVQVEGVRSTVYRARPVVPVVS